MAGSGNPFRPGVGTRPLLLAGRGDEIEDFRRGLRNAPGIFGNLKVTGLRGVGKTVLLGEFESIARVEGWATVSIEIEPHHNAELALTSAIGYACHAMAMEVSLAERAKAQIDRLREAVRHIGIKQGEVSLNFDLGRATDDRPLTEVLVAAVDCAMGSSRKGLVLMLDEAHSLRDDAAQNGEHPVTMLLTAVAGLQRKAVPLLLVVCGLPTLQSNLQKARTYSERMFLGVEVDRLEAEDARLALVGPLRETLMEADEDFVVDVLARADGYPYFLQLWGAEMWDTAVSLGTSRLTLELLRSRQFKVMKRLDRDFYRPRFDLLTPVLQETLTVAGRCQTYPPIRLNEVQELTWLRPKNVSKNLGRLVDAGAIYRIRPGEYEYSAPGFHGYLLRHRIDPEGS